MKVVILCGGKGTRLGLGGLPKPMVSIDGVPLLERTVRLAASKGFEQFIFLCGHGAGAIRQHFGDGTTFGVNIEHIVETAPLGTAGSFLQIRELVTEPVVVIYGDILIDVDLAVFAKFALDRGGAATLFVHPNDHPEDSDLLEVDQDGRVVTFHAKPHPDGARYPNLVSAALYLLAPRALDYVPAQGASDWGRDIFPALCRNEPVFAYRSCEYAKDIGTPDRLERAVGHLRQGRVARLSRRNAKAAVFLDRDGVINIERNGLLRAADVSLIPGSAMAIRALNEAGIPAICVTNQPFLAKGLLDWPTLRAVNGEIDHQLAEASGAYLDDLLICPHHPERGWEGEIPELKISCDCRKPEPGLLMKAAAFHNVDLGKSWMIGDRYRDVEAGRRAGTRTALVRTGHAGNDHDEFPAEADRIFSDLEQAVAAILKDVA